MPQKVVWDDIEWEPVSDEVSRRVIMGDNMMGALYIRQRYYLAYGAAQGRSVRIFS
ncbi:hypothetical protein D1BOALGB6SA_7768 [Olavius sp. associated proteobacterium Delta 1]|nr:hypothetical protein D1BOALGB6SA_7768 [Olavius sp. associated proteobacterium Delta 1]